MNTNKTIELLVIKQSKWFYFSVNALHGAPSNMIRVNPVDDVRGYLKKADYLVHLSGNEAYCYSITEALSMGVPVIAKDIPILKELGFEDKKHGYIVKDGTDRIDFYNVPRFKPFEITDDDKAVDKWFELLGDAAPKHDYIPEQKVTVTALKVYKDMELERTITPGEKIEVWKDRAEYLRNIGLVEIGG